MNFKKKFCNVYFTKHLEDHTISTNIDINERLWTGRFGENGTNLRFSLYTGTGLYI